MSYPHSCKDKILLTPKKDSESMLVAGVFMCRCCSMMYEGIQTPAEHIISTMAIEAKPDVASICLLYLL